MTEFCTSLIGAFTPAPLQGSRSETVQPWLSAAEAPWLACRRWNDARFTRVGRAESSPPASPPPARNPRIKAQKKGGKESERGREKKGGFFQTAGSAAAAQQQQQQGYFNGLFLSLSLFRRAALFPALSPSLCRPLCLSLSFSPRRGSGLFICLHKPNLFSQPDVS